MYSWREVIYYTPANGVWGYIGITLFVCPSVLNKLNVGYNRDRAFILHMCIPYIKTFQLVPNNLTLWPTYENMLNNGYNFWILSDRAFILHMYIPYGKTFLLVPKILTLWPCPWLLSYFWKKKLNLGRYFSTERDRNLISGMGIPIPRHLKAGAHCRTSPVWPPVN